MRPMLYIFNDSRPFENLDDFLRGQAPKPPASLRSNSTGTILYKLESYILSSINPLHNPSYSGLLRSHIWVLIPAPYQI